MFSFIVLDLQRLEALGKPNCRHGPHQCDGDADGCTETFFKYNIYGKDFAMVVMDWKKKDAELVGGCPRPE